MLASALHPLNDFEIKRLQACSHPSIDWRLFTSLVERHRVAPTVYRNLSRQTAATVPEPVLSGLRRNAELNRQRVLQSLSSLNEVSSWFASEGIKLVSLKGPLLAQRLFEDASLRASKDLDLLIHPASLTQADHLLLANGCERTFPAAPLTGRQWRVYQQEGYHNTYILPGYRVPLELHWAIDSANLLQPAISHVMLARAQPVGISDVGLFTLADEDLPVYLLVHGARHQWVRLKWLLDIVVWMRGASSQDWHQWIKKVEALGLTRALAQALLLSSRLFSPTIPEPTQTLITSLPVAERLANDSLRAIQDIRYTGAEVGQMERLKHLLYLMRLKTGLCHKWTTLNRIWISPEDWQDLPLPDRFFLLYWPLRPILWLWRNHLRPRLSQDKIRR